MTYLVRGTVTGFDYELLSGASVVVKNLRTGDSKTLTVADAGTYSTDLDVVGDYPNGKAAGDEVSISVTHRGLTRTWKRRVRSTEIEQDAWFTHGTWRGTLTRAGLLVVDVFTSFTGTTIEIRDGLTRDVVEIKKNGTVLASSAWAFAKPNTITLTAAAVATDVYEVKRAMVRGIDAAKDAVLNVGDAEVRNATARHYTTPLGLVPELRDISEALSAARLRDEAYTRGDKIDSDAKTMRSEATRKLKEIRLGERNLTDEEGALVTPQNQAVSVPQSTTPTPTRRFSLFADEKVDL